MRIGYITPLERAWDRIGTVLLRPFDPVKWLVIGFAAWLAGLAGNFGAAFGWNGDDAGLADLGRLGDGGDWLAWAWAIPLAVVVLMVVLAIVVLLFWLSSRAKFIFLDNVVRDEAAVAAPWTRYRRLGDSLFLWRLAFAAVTLVAMLAAVLVLLGPAVLLAADDALHGLSFVGIFLGAGILLLLGLAAGFVLLLLDSFVVPIMYRFDLTATEAWRAFLPWFKARPGAFVLYALLLVAIAIPVMLAYSIVCVLTCCLAALPYVGTVVLLPVWVGYRAFSVEFLAQMHTDFDLFRPGLVVRAG